MESWKSSAESKEGAMLSFFILTLTTSPSTSSVSHSLNKHASRAYCLPGTELGEHSSEPRGGSLECVFGGGGSSGSQT